MSWNLEADVILGDEVEAFDLVTAFYAQLGGSITSIRLEASRPGWSGPVFSQDSVDTVADLPDTLQRYCQYLLGEAVRVQIDFELSVHSYGQTYPRLGIQLFGPIHPGRTGRRRADAVIELGNRKIYDGRVQLTGGLTLTEQFVIDLLEHICRVVSPSCLFLLAEEAVSFPISYHFVFHNQLRGFADDIREIVQLSKHGGRGYTDGRSTYPPALTDQAGETMMFGKRHGEWLAATKQFLAAKISRLDEDRLPTDFEPEFMNDVLLECTDIDFFQTHNNGLGVYGLPILVGYCEDPYFEIMERLSI